MTIVPTRDPGSRYAGCFIPKSDHWRRCVPTRANDATSFEDARARQAFDEWLEWARAVPPEDLRYQGIAAELKAAAA